MNQLNHDIHYHMLDYFDIIIVMPYFEYRHVMDFKHLDIINGCFNLHKD